MSDRPKLLDDCDECPLKGPHYHKLMQDVPADYLCQVWNDTGAAMTPELRMVLQYIRQRRADLKGEHPQGAWAAATRPRVAL